MEKSVIISANHICLGKMSTKKRRQLAYKRLLAKKIFTGPKKINIDWSTQSAHFTAKTKSDQLQNLD